MAFRCRCRDPGTVSAGIFFRIPPAISPRHACRFARIRPGFPFNVNFSAREPEAHRKPHRRPERPAGFAVPVPGRGRRFFVPCCRCRPGHDLPRPRSADALPGSSAPAAACWCFRIRGRSSPGMSAAMVPAAPVSSGWPLFVGTVTTNNFYLLVRISTYLLQLLVQIRLICWYCYNK